MILYLTVKYSIFEILEPVGFLCIWYMDFYRLVVL